MFVDQWNNKPSLFLFQLPYYIDGDIKVTQSNAVLRHIARKHGLCGETAKEKSIVDVLENQLMDFRNGFVGLCYNPNNFEENKKAFLKKVSISIKAFADFLGEKNYLAGDKITFVDFVMYELLDQHKVLEPSLLESHANLQVNHSQWLPALPAIAKYMKSDKFIVRPINNPMAVFK
ncbi:hypothetical protein QZH41_016188 [Actinostola sp. cb2023]|nr:hypothetical protein QZH41_016188 [Actinostola sp. cb2023]